MEHHGTVIVGGGIIGSAVAMHLAEAGDSDVVVVDPDLAGGRSSSERNAGGVRATWWQAINVELCARTIDYYAEHAAELGLRRCGYLWLYPDHLWAGAREHIALQNDLGREIEELSAEEVARRWPFIDRLEGIAGATFSPLDGLVNPNAVKEHYRQRARAAGVRFLDRRLVVRAERSGDRVSAIAVRELADERAAYSALRAQPANGASTPIGCERLVNAAGPWAGHINRLIGAPDHSRAVPRQVCVIACRDLDLSDEGMIVDTSGCYLHHEGGDRFLAGYSPPGDPPGYDFTYEGPAFFEREIWPRLASRMSAMDRLEHVRGWTGLYELSPDNSALVGQIEGLVNAYEIHSFSGRGVMQSYAAALALSELITLGRHETFPAAAGLSARRIPGGQALPEELHI